MRREELLELAKLHGIDLAAVELTDENLEAIVGGKDLLGGGGGGGFGGFGGSSSSGGLQKLVRGGSTTTRF
jgi:hypothetical protein